MMLPFAAMPRTAFALALGAAALGWANAHAADAVRVREPVSVAGAMVTLGELFRGVAPEKAGREVLRAPDPGRTRRISASLLNRIAEDHGVAWQTRDNGTITRVRRKSHEVPRKRIKAAVRRALSQRDVSDDLNIVLSNPNIDLVLPTHVPATVRLEDFTYRRGANRFSARALAPAEGQMRARTTITGEVRRMVEVPVLNRRIARDERVREDDVKWVTRPQSDVRNNTVTEAAKLVGNIARRPLSPGEMLRDTAVTEPILVEDGSLVTIRLRSGRMRLSAKGRALEDGAMKDTVRVENVKSERTVTGVVTGPGVVEVAPNTTPTN